MERTNCDVAFGRRLNQIHLEALVRLGHGIRGAFFLAGREVVQVHLVLYDALKMHNF
jgi:hypothetical protein